MRTVLLGLAALAIAGPASANLVTNGSFENVAPTSVNASGNFEFGASFPANLNAVVGWSSPDSNAYNLSYDSTNAFTPAGNAQGRFVGTGNEFLQPGTGSGPSPDGGRFVALDGDSNFDGPFEQLISGLTPGAQYLLTFSWAAAQVASRVGPTTEQLQVTFGSDVQSTAVVNNPDAGFTGWFSESFTFTADSATQLLSFLSIGTPNGLPPIALLDGVSLVQTPEPAGLALFGLGLAAFAVARSRRR